MLVHVSQPHTQNIEFTIRGNIPEDLLSELKAKYGQGNVVEEDEDLVKARDIDWDLLNPPREFHNMRSKCETSLWNTFSIHMQHRIYRLIRDRKRRGETVHPNPWYAIVNARDAEPTNYNGDARIDDLSKTTKMVVAWYKERAGIYTLEEALALKLSIIRWFN